MRLDLPSKFRYYSDKTLKSDKLTVGMLADIYEAHVTKSTRSLIMTLQALTKFPLMSTLPQDFRWYLRQVSITSYSKQTRTHTWTSKYGNRVVSEVDLVQFEVTELPDEFELPKGFRFPTMSDYCDIEEIDSIAKTWLYKQAQYIDKPTWQERIEALSLDKLDTIKMLSNYHFGVSEWITVVDYTFDIDKYLAKCKRAKTLLTDEKQDFSSKYLALKEEIERWEEVKLSGAPVEVDPERIYFPISASILLP